MRADRVTARVRQGLQRLVRRFPGPARRAWALVPSVVKEALGPLVHPIAAGSRIDETSFDMTAPAGEWPVPVPSALATDPETPLVSVVIVTWGNLALSRLCLDSVLGGSAWPKLEIIVVDNGSTDGTPAWLSELARRDGRVHLILNQDNRGFAAANNQGIRAAHGALVVLLNNDTVVPPHWLARLVAPLGVDPAVGLVGPVTNRIGNAAQIDVAYRDRRGMHALADERAARQGGAIRDLPMLALFCAAARRTELLDLGLLDERFAVGMFEDDDLSRRYHAAGLRTVLAEGCFVHHFGQASFGRLPDDEYLRIWEGNRRRFEEKWGVRWIPPSQP